MLSYTSGLLLKKDTLHLIINKLCYYFAVLLCTLHSDYVYYISLLSWMEGMAGQ